MGIYAITGASSGIGAAIGRQLKAQGHYVINISRRAAAEDAADVNISADLAMKAERGRALEALYAAAPDGLDGFVSCSGVGPTQPADVIVSINYFAAREMTEGAYPLVEKKKGVILVVSSNSATLPQLNTELVDIMLTQRLPMVKHWRDLPNIRRIRHPRMLSPAGYAAGPVLGQLAASA